MTRGGASGRAQVRRNGAAKEQREQPSVRHGGVIFGRVFDFFEILELIWRVYPQIYLIIIFQLI